MKRRSLLLLGSAVAGLGAVGWIQRNSIFRSVLTSFHNDELNLTSAAVPGDDVCLLTPEQIEGPYFVPSPRRSDITEDREGLPLSLNIQVIDTTTCDPVEDALVEVWHCDAAGRYSAFPEELRRKPFDTMLFIAGDGNSVNDKTYLRGSQATDSEGGARFKTIFPGWYDPRVTHIHVKVVHNGTAYLTTQLYFPDELAAKVYGEDERYSEHGMMPYRLSSDTVLRTNPDAQGLLLDPVESGNGLSANVKLGIPA